MKVLKSTPSGSPPPASVDSPVPRMNRNSTGCTSEVTARSRSVLNLISSRRQTMLTARRSCRIPWLGAETLIESMTAASAARVTVSVTSVPSPEARRHLAHRLGRRRLGIADGLARVGHEDVVKRRPGHADRPDRKAKLGEEPGHELLAPGDRERHRPLVNGRLDAEAAG